MQEDLQSDRVERRVEHRILIDRSAEIVWKRVCDLRAMSAGFPALRVEDATPSGDTVCAEAVVTVSPFRMRFVGIASLVEADDVARQATLQIEARDHYGRGKLEATAVCLVHPVGSGAEVIVALQVGVAGAVVRATDGAVLADLDELVRSWFVALAADAFMPDEPDPGEALFEMPVYGLVDHRPSSPMSEPEAAHASEPEPEPEPDLELEPDPDPGPEVVIDLVSDDVASAFSRIVEVFQDNVIGETPMIDLTAADPPAMLAPASAAPAQSFATFLATVPSVDLVVESSSPTHGDPDEVLFEPNQHNVFARAALVTADAAPAPAPVIALPLESAIEPEPVVAGAKRAEPVRAPRPTQGGLPAPSLPQRGGRLRSHAAKVTHAVGTAAAGAAVVAAVAGVYAARRWLGRR